MSSHLWSTAFIYYIDDLTLNFPWCLKYPHSLRGFKIHFLTVLIVATLETAALNLGSDVYHSIRLNM